MRSRIGSSLINRLKTEAKVYEIRDNALKGFILRVQPSGIMTYYCEYERGKRIRLGRVQSLSPSQARQEAANILSKVHLGEDPMQERRDKQDKAMTLEQYFERDYFPYIRAHLKAGEATKKRLDFNFSHLYNRPLMDIRIKDIEVWQTKRLAEGRKPSTINRDLTSIKAALNKAVDYKYLSENPIGRVKRLKVDSNPNVRFLSREEHAALMDVLDEREERMREERERANSWRKERDYPLMPDLRHKPFADHMKPMVILSLNTGLRRGELLHLRWENVNFEQGIMTIEASTAKGNRTRHISLSPMTKALLKEWRTMFDDRSGIVFPSKDGKPFQNVKTPWLRILRDANIQNFRWHDMRHHFASRLVMGGVDLNKVRELLGHSDYKMTLRYAHLAQEHKTQAVEVLDQPY